MAYTNTKLKYDFTDSKGNSLTLTFSPAHNTDFSSPVTYDFPKGFVTDTDMIIERGFEDDLPIGLELAHAMDFEINLELLTGTYGGTENFDDIRKAILSGIAPNTRTVNGRALYIPNVWTLYDNTNNKRLFHGVQNYTAEEEITESAIKPILYNISCTDIISYSFSRLKAQDLSVATDDTVKEVFNLNYTDIDSNTIYHSSSTTGEFNIATYEDLYNSIELKAQEIFRAIARDNTLTFRIAVDNQDITGTLASGTPTVTSMTRTDRLYPGQPISGTGIAADTVVLSIDSTTQITISKNATATGAQALVFGGSGSKYPHDIHGYYLNDTTDNTVQKGDPIYKEGFYILKNYGYYAPLSFRGTGDITEGSEHITVADSSIYLVGDYIAYVPAPLYRVYFSRVASIPDGTTLTMENVSQITGTSVRFDVTRYVLESRAGYLSDGLGANIYKYTSILDYIKTDIYNKIGKGVINYNTTTANDVALEINTLFDSWDTIGNTLDRTDIYLDTLKTKRQHNFFTEIKSTLAAQTQDGIDEYVFTNEGSENNDSITLEQTLSNDMVFADNDQPSLSGDNPRRYPMRSIKPLTPCLFGKSGSDYFRIWHGITINLGNGQSLDSDTLTATTSTMPDSTGEGGWASGVNSYIKNMKEEFAASALAYKLREILKFQNTPLLTFDTQKYELDDIGNYLIGVDVGSITNMDYYTAISDRAELTNIVYNVKRCEKTINIWVI
jgi:hypothetical protein